MSLVTTRTPLKELYDTIASANGWSLRDVVNRAKDRGHEISKSHIGNLTNTYPLPSISHEMIHALAAGLGIAPERIAVAAIQSMGFRIASGDITPAEAISRDETISDDTRRALLSILHAAERRGAG